MTNDIFLKRMMDFAQKAGEVAMAHINNSEPGLKKDQSIITKADKAISALAKEMLADFINTPGHILIDEEDAQIAGCLNQERLNQTPYIWALDPIDGTRLYANRMPLFGISLGLIKDLKPWMGVVYFPMLDELFYADGDQAYYVQHPFKSNAKKSPIVPQDEDLSARSLFFCNDTFFDKFYWKDKDFHIMIHACAVVNLCWPTIGRGIGSFLRCHIWDFAGSWPIIQKAGYEFRRVSDGKILDKVEASLFTLTPKLWQMAEYYLISTSKNYFAIKSKIAELPSRIVK